MSVAQRLDTRLQARIGRLPATPVDGALRELSEAANHGRLWLALAAVLATRKGAPRRAALRGLGSLAASSALVNVALKPVFGRVRPDVANVTSQRSLDRAPHTLSFPSGHAASAAAFAVGVAMESRRAGALAAPVALGVGYSRVHVGVHYPGDVLAGMAIGGAMALASRRWWGLTPTEPARALASEAPALADGAGLSVVVNPWSGPRGYDPAEDIAALLPAATVLTLSGDTSVEQLLQQAVREGARALGIAGGDGSVSAAAAVALEHDLPLAVLPAGTLNHFAGAVGVDTPAQAATAVRGGRAVQVDVACANEVPFLNTASLGAYPEMVQRRDRLSGRLGKWLAMAVAAAQVLRREPPARLLIEGRAVSAWILFVGNSSYTPRGLAAPVRTSMVDGLLDIAYLRADLVLGRTRAVLAILLGIGAHSRTYVHRTTPALHVVSRSGPQVLAHDGETGPAADEFCFGLGERLTVYCEPYDG